MRGRTLHLLIKLYKEKPTKESTDFLLQGYLSIPNQINYNLLPALIATRARVRNARAHARNGQRFSQLFFSLYHRLLQS